MRKSASKTVRKALSIAVFVLACSKGGYLAGQQKVSVGFWNVENLFDTIPSRFYNDLDYTPGGRLKWDTSKYRTKLSNLARVTDNSGFYVAGLAEVENEAVLGDPGLTRTLDTSWPSYTYDTADDTDRGDFGSRRVDKQHRH